MTSILDLLFIGSRIIESDAYWKPLLPVQLIPNRWLKRQAIFITFLSAQSGYCNNYPVLRYGTKLQIVSEIWMLILGKKMLQRPTSGLCSLHRKANVKMSERRDVWSVKTRKIISLFPHLNILPLIFRFRSHRCWKKIV